MAKKKGKKIVPQKKEVPRTYTSTEPKPATIIPYSPTRDTSNGRSGGRAMRFRDGDAIRE